MLLLLLLVAACIFHPVHLQGVGRVSVMYYCTHTAYFRCRPGVRDASGRYGGSQAEEGRSSRLTASPAWRMNIYPTAGGSAKQTRRRGRGGSEPSSISLPSLSHSHSFWQSPFQCYSLSSSAFPPTFSARRLPLLFLNITPSFALPL